MQSRCWLGAGLLAAALLAGFGTAGAQDSKTLLSLTVGIQPVFAYGAVEDYVPGVNDFPVTPAHRPILAGLSFGRLSGRWLFELEARWTASSRVVLEDPSDGDTVEIPTSPRASACLAVFFLPVEGRIRPYVGGAAGVDVILAGDTAATSRAGYDIRIQAPAFKDRFDPIVQAAGGLLVALGGRIGDRLDRRYRCLLDRPHPVRGLQATLSLTLAL